MDRLQNDTERKKRACVGIVNILEFHKSDLRYKRLLLFVPNFNTKSDGVIDQCYLLSLKNIIVES